MKKTDLPALETAVRRSLWIVTGIFALSLATYFLWFFIHLSLPLSANSSAWGEFGDFAGGLLNPLVAYSAFYWLTRSVLLQKEELLETRSALEESARAAVKQAAVAEQAMKVAAFTALLNSAVTEVQSLRAEANAIATQASQHPAGSTRLPSGEWVNIEAVTRHLSSVRGQIEYQNTQRIKCEQQLKVFLGALNDAA